MRKIIGTVLFIAILPFVLLAAGIMALLVWIIGDKEPWEEKPERP